MFDLKTRDEFRKKEFYINMITRILLILSVAAMFVVTLDSFNIIQIKSKTIKLISQICSIVTYVLLFANLITKQIYFNKYKKQLINEYLEILSNVQMPSQQPKVIYVYTTHNDFMPSRLLQNMQQTYKNIEYWISDGSSNEDVSKEIVEFAQKHNVNLFKMDKPSENKADNLNTFLKKSGATFDFLLIGDADVAFDKNLVKCNLRYFYSKKQKRLGYVSSMLQNYKTKNFFSNTLRFMENLSLFRKDINKVIKSRFSPNLYSACCLLSKEYLDDMGGFPEGCFEDGYLELNGSKKYWYGIVSPLTLSVQKFDENIKKYKVRQLRIIDWIIKYERTEAFRNLNQKFSSTYREYFLNLFSGPIILLSIILLPFAIMAIISFVPIFFSNYYYWIMLAVIVIGFVVLSSQVNKDSNDIMGKKNAFIFPFFLFLLFLSVWPQMIKHWFKAIILKKYSTFKPTRSRDKNKKQESKIKPIIFDIFITITSLIIVVISIVLFVINKWYEINWWMLLLFVSIVSIFGLIFLTYLSTIILYLLSFIENNKSYDDKDFVEYDNDYIKHTKIKDDFFDRNKNLDRFC